MRFAYLIMGHYDEKVDRAEIGGGKAQIIGVPNIEAACQVARELQADGVDAIEVCGAFGEEGAGKLAEATGSTISIGYVVNHPATAEAHTKLFG